MPSSNFFIAFSARELDAVLEFLHRFLERQVAGFEFLDQLFQVAEGFLEVDGLLRAHEASRG
jgi:hypothetical protein